MVIVIVVIAVVVLVGGFLVARKGFVRGSMASTPSEDRVTEPDGAEAKKDPDVSHDPTAVGRPSERGYEQKLR
jgi:hypothetical protein